ncbi:cupin domain-containing protein [Patescibacteria group bacterium]
MKINKIDELASENVQMTDAKNVVLKILIGPDDDSKDIIMRHFTVLPGGHTPLHNHEFEHVIKIEKNKGIMIDKNGREHEVGPGHCAYVEPNEKHQFKNPFDEPFEFICIIKGSK